ncbi:response regulator [Ramlibacter sp. RBP-2]|uniref:Response regulator n=1 Tax=Ramlibacter lithotrophicus TaxID=2606681 RepID=A0A7X6DHZ3_9BURK|nr:response regulator [Ramlibacter lithotrophicus]NKE67501.1 response regulator [Ramlibacter lithotrophicus]
MTRKRIMVIDDSVSLREVVGISLRSAGYEVTEACDGQDALSKLNGSRFHLMICDVNMPVMDGISFVREVKQLPRHRFVPIIMLTTESRESRKAEGQLAGAKAWVVKPFRPDQMLQAVAKLILP